MTRVKQGSRKRIYAPKTKSGCITCRSTSPSGIPHTLALANRLAIPVRRVKCDESKPTCDRCTSTGRKCDGYLSEDHPKATCQDLSARPSPFANASAHEFRAFQFFHEQTRHQLSGFHDCELWDMLVLQVAQEDVAVRHALVAFSTLHETFARRLTGHGDNQVASDQLALRQYNLAIRRHLDQLGGARFPANLDERAMVPCLIFICIEIIRGHYTLCITLLKRTFGMLDHLKRNIALGSRRSNLHEMFERQLIRLESQVIATIGYEAWDNQGNRSSISYRPLPTIPSVFASATEARDLWETYWHIYTAASARESQVAAPYDRDAEPLYHHAQQQDYTRPDFWVAGFTRWSEAPEATVRSSTSAIQRNGVGVSTTTTPPPSQKEQCALKILQLHRLLNVTLVDLVSRQTLEDLEVDSQMHWDHSTPVFEQMLDLAESVLAAESDTGPQLSNPIPTPTTTEHPPFSLTTSSSSSSSSKSSQSLSPSQTTPKSPPVFTLDTSIVSPIYDVAKHSRDPVVRRRAISLLYNYPRHEGMFDGVLHARVAQRIGQIEEEGCLDHSSISSSPSAAADVPDWARISQVRPIFDLEKSRIVLHYQRRRDKDSPFRVPVEEVIELE